MSWCRLRLLTCGLLTVLASINTARGQILSAVFSQCTTGASPAPWEQLINISSVYAQLDLSTRPARSHSSVNASVDFPDGQAILRLVASADTAARSEGFSNVTNYLGLSPPVSFDMPIKADILVKSLTVTRCMLDYAGQPPSL